MARTIDKLSAVDAITAGDLFVVWDTSNGDSRKASVTTLMTYINANISSPAFTTQREAPTATGFTVAVTNTSQNTFLILTPGGAYAAGTITLPANANLADKQEVLVTCTQAITTLTIAGNGTSVNGAPTTIAANGFFRLRYDSTNNAWYRVG